VTEEVCWSLKEDYRIPEEGYQALREACWVHKEDHQIQVEDFW